MSWVTPIPIIKRNETRRSCQSRTKAKVKLIHPIDITPISCAASIETARMASHLTMTTPLKLGASQNHTDIEL